MIAPNKKQDLNRDADTSPKVSAFGKFFWYLIFILIIPLFIHIGNVNKLKKMDTKVLESESGIDVQLKRRRDTLIKLMDTVKGSIDFEKSTLEKVTNMRMGGGAKEMMENNRVLDQVSRNIMIQVENYPNLKSTELFQSMSNSINEIEEDIAASRRIYNGNVSSFNQAIKVWPINVAGSSIKAKNKYFFEITEEDRTDVKIGF
ncbi:LemA family protein [Spiroplasma endosymbiont of Cantharis rufa]|uniref:LemA family protein n=1 Tax=Spiroplasma endosymbiont of Cantharis rufa TaxID=3066279 RepID=UPI0030CB6A6D